MPVEIPVMMLLFLFSLSENLPVEMNTPELKYVRGLR